MPLEEHEFYRESWRLDWFDGLRNRLLIAIILLVQKLSTVILANMAFTLNFRGFSRGDFRGDFIGGTAANSGDEYFCRPGR